MVADETMGSETNARRDEEWDSRGMNPGGGPP